MPSFDVVSEVDLQEVRNAVNQTARGVAAAIDVLRQRLVRRGLPLEASTEGEVRPVGQGRTRKLPTVDQGIPRDAATALGREIRGPGLKRQGQVKGDRLRVQAKKRDDLQRVIAHLRHLDHRPPCSSSTVATDR